MKNYLVKTDERTELIQNIQTVKFNIILLLAGLMLISSICYSQNLLKGPQRIVIDAKRNLLLASNYNTGDIIAIDSVGNQSYFVKGAGFVDGIEIVGDTIYGSGNNRTFRGYDLNTKNLVMNVQMPTVNPGDDYLSSVTSDSAGHLFISCPGANTIYKLRISDQSYWIFAKGNGLNRPNGMLLEREKNRIVVIDDSPRPSKIHAISLLDSTVSELASTNFNRPDGIVRDKAGNYYVGGYYLTGLYKFDPNFGQAPELFYRGNTFVYPTYDPDDNSILVTNYNGNSWVRISLLTDVQGYNSLPEKFQLFQNYPNPFNPTTTIKYSLENQSYVKLLITNAMGEIVSILTEGIKRSGIHEISFDAIGFPSGIYFASLINGDNIQTKKMVLLK